MRDGSTCIFWTTTFIFWTTDMASQALTVAEAAVGAAKLAAGAGLLRQLAVAPCTLDQNAHYANDLGDCRRYRSVKSLGNSSLVSSLNEKCAKIQPVLVILKL